VAGRNQHALNELFTRDRLFRRVDQVHSTGNKEAGFMDESETVVDWNIFQRARSELGPGFVRILGYFREDGEKSVAKIEDAMRRRDVAAMIIPAHTLKSEARQFGAEPLGDLAEEIEFVARRSVENRLFPDELLPSRACARSTRPPWTCSSARRTRSRSARPAASAAPSPIRNSAVSEA
jgi:histidine phosphotransfer protein HptB